MNDFNQEEEDLKYKRKVLIDPKKGTITPVPLDYDFARDNARMESLYGKNWYNIMAGIGDQ